jgi:hypothetical protein
MHECTTDCDPNPEPDSRHGSTADGRGNAERPADEGPAGNGLAVTQPDRDSHSQHGSNFRLRRRLGE